MGSWISGDGIIGWIIVISLAGIIIVIYNDIVQRVNSVDRALGNIRVLTQRRYDLISQVVEVVSRYAKYEQNLYERITRLRMEAYGTSPASPEGKRIEQDLNAALKDLFAVGENYPRLKASDNYRQLQMALREVERDLALSRMAYNGAAKEYNDALMMFPWAIIAGIMGLRRKEMLSVEPGVMAKPNIRAALDEVSGGK